MAAVSLTLVRRASGSARSTVGSGAGPFSDIRLRQTRLDARRPDGGSQRQLVRWATDRSGSGLAASWLGRSPRIVDSGCVDSEQLAWSGRDWRMPVWLWVGLVTMFVSVLHIIIDFGVGLFDLRGTLSLSEAATLVGVALIQSWWAISFMAGARGNASGVASAGILGAGWAALTNGYPIVYCPPVCEEARPLTDLGHVGSIVFGILLALVAIWSLWRARVRPGWFMPAVAAALVLGTVVSLANTPIT